MLNGRFFLNGKKFGPIKGIKAQNLKAGAYRLKNFSRFSGILAKTRTWGLNGQLKLDAGISIGAIQVLGELTIKEDL